MDARAHLDSYRESLKKDALEGCGDYSRHIKTANPKKFPKVYDYLKYSLDAARYHAEADDPTSYKLWLPKHQEAMIALFELMVDEFLFGAKTATLDVTLKLIDEKGWSWFKFSKKSIIYKMTLTDTGAPLELHLVPRYNYQEELSVRGLRRLCPNGVVTLDADEVALIMATGDTAIARSIANHKLHHPAQKYLGTRLLERQPSAHFRPVEHVNGDRVEDWSLPLF